MKNIIALILIATLTQNAHAKHVISTIMDSGKLIIINDYNQKIRNGKMDTIKLIESKKGDKTSVSKIGEHAMPKVGDKIKLYRTKYTAKGGMEERTKKVTKDFIGNATVIEPNLEGDTRVVTIFSNRKSDKVESKNLPFSQKELNKIKENALVAVPDIGVQAKEYDSVEF